jgi:hypothetical protein
MADISAQTTRGTIVGTVLIPMKVITDSDLIPVTCSDAIPITVGAKRRWRPYGA